MFVVRGPLVDAPCVQDRRADRRRLDRRYTGRVLADLLYNKLWDLRNVADLLYSIRLVVDLLWILLYSLLYN